MSLETVTYSPGTCIRCGGNDGYEAADGDVVKVYLNQDRIPAFPEWIEGIIVGVTQASATDTSRTYTVQYETDDLEGSALLLSSCDILSLICTSCCEILQEQFDAWANADEPFVQLSYYWDEDSGKVWLYANAYSRVPGVTIDTYGWIDPDEVAIDETDVPGLEVPDSELSTFLGGWYGVNVTDSAGHSTVVHVYVDPTKLKFRTENTTITTGNSTKAVALNEGETIASVVQTTAASGILLESITYAGDPPTATLTFTGTPAVASVGLQLLIQRSLP